MELSERERVILLALLLESEAYAHMTDATIAILADRFDVTPLRVKQLTSKLLHRLRQGDT